eukprot:252890_1
MSNLSYILWYIPLIPAVILLLISIYANIKLRRSKNEMYMTKRAIPLELNCSMIFAMFFAILFYSSTVLNNIWLTVIFKSAFYAAWFLLFSFLNARSWMIYFRYRWTYYTLQLEWQQLINPNIVKEKEQKNWYIRNYKRYGNVSYIYRMFGFLHFIAFIGTVSFFITHTTQIMERAIFGCIFMFIPAIYHIIIVYKIPIFHDYYFIHRESKLHGKLSIVLLISCVVSQMFIFKNKPIAGLISILTIPYILFLMIYVSTFMVMSKNINQKDSDNISDAQRVRSHSMQISLDDILSDSKSLHLFMVHLTKEFSIELILSYIEFYQFQEFCLNEINSVKIIIHTDDKREIMDTQPHVETMHMNDLKNVPKSQIVHETCSSIKFDLTNLHKQILADSKMKAHELYNKYIAQGSKFEINISDKMRKKLINILEDKDNLMNKININLADLVKLFEEPKNEMKMLLQYSYERFKDSEEYEEVIKILRPQTMVTDMEILDRIKNIL